MNGIGEGRRLSAPGQLHIATVIPAPYRHSRVSGNPERYDTKQDYCRPVFLDSRLRGNDGSEAAGMAAVGDWGSNH